MVAMWDIGIQMRGFQTMISQLRSLNIFGNNVWFIGLYGFYGSFWIMLWSLIIGYTEYHDTTAQTYETNRSGL